MNVKDFENQRWTRDDQKVCFRHRAAVDLIIKNPRYSRHTGASPRVLDLGCGDGLLLSLLKEKGISGRGIDLSDKAIEKAKAKGLDVSAFDFGGSGTKLPFPSGSFDTVIMLDVLEHMYAPGELLTEATRVSNGSVIVGVPNFNSLPARLQVMRGRVPENNHPHKGHIYWFNRAVLENMARESGLVHADHRVNTVMEHVPIVGAVCRSLAKHFPSLFALSFVYSFKNMESSKIMLPL